MAVLDCVCCLAQPLDAEQPGVCCKYQKFILSNLRGDIRALIVPVRPVSTKRIECHEVLQRLRACVGTGQEALVVKDGHEAIFVGFIGGYRSEIIVQATHVKCCR